MGSVVNYELYIFKNGRWELASRFEESSNQAAIDEAIHYEELTQKPTKLVKESFNTNTLKSVDTVVYLSDKIRTSEKSLFTQGQKQNGNNFLSNEDETPNIMSPEPISKKTLLQMKITGLIIGSTIFATTVSFAVTTTIRNALKNSFGSMSGSSNIQIFVGTFLITLIITATPLVLKAISKADSKRKRSKKIHRPESKSLFELFIEYLLSPSDTQNKLDEENLDAYIRKEEAKLNSGFDENDLVDLDDDEDFVLEEYEMEEYQEEENNTENEKEEKKEADINKETTSISEEYEEVRKDYVNIDDGSTEVESKSPNSANYISAEKLARQFLRSVISEIKDEFPTLDSYGRFALNLLLAGACDTIQTANFMNDETYSLILKNIIMATGASQAVSDSFCDKLTEHTAVPNQAKIIETGRRIMKSMMEKDLAALSETIEVFRNWYSPIQDSGSNFHDIVTVMFTDIIGSTNFTETLGDVTAQQLIRAHNAVVRNALYEFNGIEIKHTGDGIMASFSSAASAVEAAARIQQSIEEFNKNNRSKFPLHVRIGLNSGEPIAEDDDLFGLTVQMASRICNAASEKQIFVSEVVKELAAGRAQTFEDMGVFKLKGVQEPQRLFSILWDLALVEIEEARQAEYDRVVKTGITVNNGTITAHGFAQKTSPLDSKANKPAFDEFAEVSMYSMTEDDKDKTDDTGSKEKDPLSKVDKKALENLKSFD
ncbi:MAG: adenylate/guanylate cyclase domain-containing protein [Alphaproteobacteria bacterium]|nr:adenylate/guanylate cyclase domain-containing protein [Alphaproteobacteria bacterium]